jgi:hypothetical protein
MSTGDTSSTVTRFFGHVGCAGTGAKTQTMIVFPRIWALDMMSITYGVRSV